MSHEAGEPGRCDVKSEFDPVSLSEHWMYFKSNTILVVTNEYTQREPPPPPRLIGHTITILYIQVFSKLLLSNAVISILRQGIFDTINV